MKIPVMNNRLTFGEAFKFARETGASRFEWRGKCYTTELFEERAAPKTVPVGERIVKWIEVELIIGREISDKEHVDRIKDLFSALNNAMENAAKDGIETTVDTFPARRMNDKAEYTILSGKIRKVLE